MVTGTLCGVGMGCRVGLRSLRMVWPKTNTFKCEEMFHTKGLHVDLARCKSQGEEEELRRLKQQLNQAADVLF